VSWLLDLLCKSNPNWATQQAHRLFQKAEYHWLAGELEKDEQTLRRVLTLKPDYPEAWYNLGTSLMEQYRLWEAIDCFKKAIQYRPDYSKAYFNLASTYMKSGLWNEAIRHFELALQYQPDDEEAEEALQAARRGKEENPSGCPAAEALVSLAAEQGLAGNLEEAMATLEKALNARPRDAELLALIHYQRGKIFEKWNNIQRMRECLETAISNDPNLAEVHNDLGTAYARLGDHEKACDEYRRAVQLKPDYINALRNFAACCLSDLQRPGKAIEPLERLYQLQPTEETRNWLVAALLSDTWSIGGYHAIAHCQRALEVAPENHLAWYHLGTFQREGGNWEEAIEAFRRAIELCPSDSRYHNDLGYLYMQLGWYEAAEAEFESALKYNPRDKLARRNLSLLRDPVWRLLQ
jgi:tetratricopeptide (TPR) repeat protein